LFIAVEFHEDKVSARQVCEQLIKHGILSKETHHTVARFAPPLTISREQIDMAMTQIKDVISNLE